MQVGDTVWVPVDGGYAEGVITFGDRTTRFAVKVGNATLMFPPARVLATKPETAPVASEATPTSVGDTALETPPTPATPKKSRSAAKAAKPVSEPVTE